MNKTFISTKIIGICSLLITLAIPFSSHGKDAFEYSDTELKEAGWSQIQIDQMREEHRKSSSKQANQSQDTKRDTSLPKAESDSSNLKPPSPDYLDNNRWAGLLKECCRMPRPTILPATIVFSGDQAELETRGKYTCSIKYKWLKGERQKFALKQKTGGHKTITRDIYESRGSQTGNCRRMQYLTIGKGKNGLSVGMSRRKKGSTDYNSFFQPSVQTIAEVAGCEQLIKHSTEGNVAGVRSSLDRGMNPNCKFNRETPLYNAVRHIRMASDSNLPIVKMLVAAGAKVATVDRYSEATPTTLAAYLGHRKTTSYLMSNGGTKEDLQEAKRIATAKNNQFLVGLGLSFKGGQWLTDKISESIKAGAEADSKGLLRGYYICSTKCTGQGGAYRGDPGTIRIYAPNGYTAVEETKDQFKSVCKSYHFYAGGGGSASPSLIECDLQ